jgi:hypothetical protein
MKTASKPKRKTPASAAKSGKYAPLQTQPPLKSQAAAKDGMFLFTDDKWSLAYFDQNDLHYEERELFG